VKTTTFPMILNFIVNQRLNKSLTSYASTVGIKRLMSFTKQNTTGNWD
jgi:hypothetical protein